MQSNSAHVTSLDRIEQELTLAIQALEQGNDGRARVCARRAVWYALSDKIPSTTSAIGALQYVAQFLPEDLSQRALRLCKGERHRLQGEELSTTPVEDARSIITFIDQHPSCIPMTIHSAFRISSIVLAIAIFSVTSIVLGQQNYPASWKLSPSRLTAHDGDTVTIRVSATIDPGWHIYGIKSYLTADGIGPQRTEFSFRSSDLHILERAIAIRPSPRQEYDSAFEITVEKLKGTVTFMLPVVIARSKAGIYRDTLVVYHQICTSKNCLPPEEILLPTELQLLPTRSARDTTALSTNHDQPTNTNSSISSSAQESVRLESSTGSVPSKDTGESSSNWLTLLGLALVLGIGSWIMPCVYPMIPITVSYFTKRADRKHTHPILDSLVYSTGIISTFVVFGAVAAFFFGATAGRDIATNPWLNAVLALLFLVIAGNLFGMYELRLPASLVNTLNRESTRVQGYRSTFLMGMVFSLTSFTCTVPFVDLIAKMAAGGEWFRPLVAMTFYAFVFAFPFFLLALFPTVLQRIPRSGEWMNHIKVSLAFIEIAFAISYFARVDSIVGWQVLSRELVLAVWASCTLLIALYLLGVFRAKLDSPLEHVSGIRATFATVFVALTLYLLQGMFGGSVGTLESFIYVESARPNAAREPEAEMQQSPSKDAVIPLGKWTEDLEAALASARRHNVPVFVDFTGVSCTNCRWMEKNIFPQPDVQKYFQKMVLVRAYTDRRNNPRDEYYKRLQQERYGSTLLPYYVILSPTGQPLATATYTSNLTEFIRFLQSGSRQTAQN